MHLTTPSKPLSDDLIAAFQRAQAAGGLPGIGLAVDDCRATYEQLKAKGVEFLQAPEERPYGVEALMRDNSGAEALMRDNSGNWMVLVEARAYGREDFEGFADAGGVRRLAQLPDLGQRSGLVTFNTRITACVAVDAVQARPLTRRICGKGGSGTAATTSAMPERILSTEVTGCLPEARSVPPSQKFSMAQKAGIALSLISLPISGVA